MKEKKIQVVTATLVKEKDQFVLDVYVEGKPFYTAEFYRNAPVHRAVEHMNEKVESAREFLIALAKDGCELI